MTRDEEIRAREILARGWVWSPEDVANYKRAFTMSYRQQELRKLILMNSEIKEALREMLWVALCYNDHNYRSVDLIRKCCAVAKSLGVTSVHEANEYLNEVEEEPAERVCRWVKSQVTNPDVDRLWDTGCGNVYAFINGGPKENDQKFCGYCAGRIEVGRALAK